VTLNEAERLPLAEGVNMVTIVQVPPAATDEPQVLFSVKSAGSGPVNPRPEMFKAVPELFDKVTVSGELATSTGWFPKLTLLVEKLTPVLPFPPALPLPLPLEFVPVPDMGTDCGLLGALSVNETAAANEPAPLGANWTLMVQLDPTAKLPLHLLVSRKQLG
jgi:hypothetical protein